jgi:hypothetical protein
MRLRDRHSSLNVVFKSEGLAISQGLWLQPSVRGVVDHHVQSGTSHAIQGVGVVASKLEGWSCRNHPPIVDGKSWVPRNNDVIILKDILPVTESCIVGVSGANLLPAWCLLLTDPSWHDCRG